MASKPGVSTLYLRVPRADRWVIYEPNPPQTEFHAAREKYRWLVGGVGGGKSACGCVEALLTAMEYPGSVGLVGRWAHRELTATTWKMLKDIVPRRLIVNECESSQKTLMDLRAPNGRISRIWGWPLSNMSSLHSLNLDWFYIDESDKVPPNKGRELWSTLTARLRGNVGPLRGWLTGNPNGRDWQYDIFVKKGYRDHRYVLSPTRFNIPNLPDDYEQKLRRENSPEWIARYLDSQFNEFQGSIYWSYNEAIHVFSPFAVPAHWPLFLSMDWGLSDPCAAHLLTADEHGNVFVIREYYQANRLVSDQCKDILGMIAGVRQEATLDWAVVDPSADRRDQVTGESLLAQYRKGGLPLMPGNRDLDGGIAAVQEWLKVDPERVHPITKGQGSPRLHVGQNCPHLREQFQTYRWGPNGRPIDDEDHAVDSIRYGLMRRPHAADPLRGDPVNRDWQEFWDDMAREEGWSGGELPLIGAGARGRMVA